MPFCSFLASFTIFHISLHFLFAANSKCFANFYSCFNRLPVLRPRRKKAEASIRWSQAKFRSEIFNRRAECWAGMTFLRFIITCKSVKSCSILICFLNEWSKTFPCSQVFALEVQLERNSILNRFYISYTVK